MCMRIHLVLQYIIVYAGSSGTAPTAAAEHLMIMIMIITIIIIIIMNSMIIDNYKQ